MMDEPWLHLPREKPQEKVMSRSLWESTFDRNIDLEAEIKRLKVEVEELKAEIKYLHRELKDALYERD